MINNTHMIENIFENKGFNFEDRWDFYNFWSKVDIKENKEDCWNWNSFIDDGYGRYHHYEALIQAHRMAYILSNGTIPDRLLIQHFCNNRRCCNPNHLELGNSSKNNRYTVECGMRNKSNGQSKLTEDQVREIHIIYKEHKLTHKDIGDIFGISRAHVTGIINGKTWPRIYEEMRK